MSRSRGWHGMRSVTRAIVLIAGLTVSVNGFSTIGVCLETPGSPLQRIVHQSDDTDLRASVERA